MDDRDQPIVLTLKGKARERFQDRLRSLFYGWDAINLALERGLTDDDSADKEARIAKTIELVANFASRVADFFGPSVRSVPPHTLELDDLLREGLDSLYPGRVFPPMTTFEVARKSMRLYLRHVNMKPRADLSFHRGEPPRVLSISRKGADAMDASKKRETCCSFAENEVREDVSNKTVGMD